MVTNNCKTGVYCTGNGAGNLQTCDAANQIVSLRQSSEEGSFACVEDIGQCPSSFGGFNVVPDTQTCKDAAASTTTTTEGSVTTSGAREARPMEAVLGLFFVLKMIF